MSGENLSIFVAFIAGIASFLSPCVLRWCQLMLDT